LAIGERTSSRLEPKPISLLPLHDTSIVEIRASFGVAAQQAKGQSLKLFRSTHDLSSEQPQFPKVANQIGSHKAKSPITTELAELIAVKQIELPEMVLLREKFALLQDCFASHG
jgi:hypothetical protein